MAARFEIPADLVEFILLGPEEDHRQLQDTPVLGDVWLAYAEDPTRRRDLLITPHRTFTAGNVCKAIAERLAAVKRPPNADPTQLAYLQGIVAVRLSFEEMLRVLIPLTEWWTKRKVVAELKGKLGTPNFLRTRISPLLKAAHENRRRRLEPESGRGAPPRFSSIDRFLALAGLILWGVDQELHDEEDDQLARAIDDVAAIAQRLQKVLQAALAGRSEALIFYVSRNRKTTPALDHSVRAVKADAARSLFSVKCDRIAWAILDTGIQADHAAFSDGRNGSRVVAAYDFGLIRRILSKDGLDAKTLASVKANAKSGGFSAKQVDDALAELRRDLDNELPVNWGLVERLIKMAAPSPPSNPHGTHVAGILGAGTDEKGGHPAGMCPEIQLYDFRVIAETLEETEFAIIAALQFIRFLNQQHSYVSIHGANLSLSIAHNVRNYACGYTPVCTECERLVESGVTVVVAAGNRGYQSFKVEEGLFENYAAFSITDPGNADGVITVGATHPRAPHSYGVSFFSSRGPTGDGRLKPDLVAPGERIQAPVSSDGSRTEWGVESGTSMAAPHVSGAAAMLMARYSELVGAPRRIKKILCESATDLGRERSFQGHGMLDVLRAFQSI